MTFDPAVQRRIMGRFATGVTVVTTRFGEGQYWAMTANSVTSVSLEPPLVLIAVAKHSSMCECIASGMCYAVNILTTEQEAISRKFASHGPKDFNGLVLKFAESGAPILADSLAYLDCKVAQIIPAGDHDIFIGQVLAGEIGEGQPLLFYNGRYTRVAMNATGLLIPGEELLDSEYDPSTNA